MANTQPEKFIIRNMTLEKSQIIFKKAKVLATIICRITKSVKKFLKFKRSWAKLLTTSNSPFCHLSRWLIKACKFGIASV